MNGEHQKRLEIGKDQQQNQGGWVKERRGSTLVLVNRSRHEDVHRALREGPLVTFWKRVRQKKDTPPNELNASTYTGPSPCVRGGGIF